VPFAATEEYEHRKRGEVGGGWATATVPQLSSQRDSQAVPVPMALANGEEEEEESEEEEEDDEDEGAAPSRPASGLPTLADTASAPASAKVPAAPLTPASAPASYEPWLAADSFFCRDALTRVQPNNPAWPHAHIVFWNNAWWTSSRLAACARPFPRTP